MSVHQAITGAGEVDLVAIAADYDSLAERFEARLAVVSRGEAAALGLAHKARTYRHLAADARCAADGCEASLESILAEVLS